MGLLSWIGIGAAFAVSRRRWANRRARAAARRVTDRVGSSDQRPRSSIHAAVMSR